MGGNLHPADTRKAAVRDKSGRGGSALGMSDALVPNPWLELPPELVRVLRRALTGAAGELVDAVHELPAFRDALTGPYGLEPLRVAVTEAQQQLLKEAESGRRGRCRQVYFNLGRGHVRAGRDLSSLLAAYGIGARATWRQVFAAARERELDPEAYLLLGEAVFSFVESLAGQSTLGFAYESARTAGSRDLRRQELVRMLVGELPADADAIPAGAAAADWPLPSRVTAIAATRARFGSLTGRLPHSVLAAPIERLICLIAPEPGEDDTLDRIDRALRHAGQAAMCGPVVALDTASTSFDRAAAALAALPTDADPGLHRAQDHTTDLLLAQDPNLARDLVRQHLAPFGALPPASAQRLRQTLAAWLDHQGQLTPVARQLGIHPQTVRYRIRRLRELLDGALDHPEGRFELALALRLEAHHHQADKPAA